MDKIKPEMYLKTRSFAFLSLMLSEGRETEVRDNRSRGARFSAEQMCEEEYFPPQ